MLCVSSTQNMYFDWKWLQNFINLPYTLNSTDPNFIHKWYFEIFGVQLLSCLVKQRKQNIWLNKYEKTKLRYF